MADLTRAQAAEQLAGYVEAVGEAAEAGAVNADPADVFTVACRMGAAALRILDRLERATLTLSTRVAELERERNEWRRLMANYRGAHLAFDSTDGDAWRTAEAIDAARDALFAYLDAAGQPDHRPFVRRILTILHDNGWDEDLACDEIEDADIDAVAGMVVDALHDDAAGQPAQPATGATARCPNVRCRAAHEERHRALGPHDDCCEHLDGCPPATDGGQCAACRKSESGACWPHAAARFGQASGKQWTVIACQRGDQPATGGDG